MRLNLGSIDFWALIWAEDKNSRDADDRQLDDKHQDNIPKKLTAKPGLWPSGRVPLPRHHGVISMRLIAKALIVSGLSARARFVMDVNCATVCFFIRF